MAFLNDLAVHGHMSASSHLQALNALLFLFRHVLEREVGRLEGLRRMRRPQRLPVVLSVDEVRATLNAMHGMPRLIAALLYGSGMRVGEVLALRVKDLDLRACMVTVRAGKGAKDRVTMLPARKPQLGVVRLNQRQQRRPRHDLIHLGQEHFPARALALA